MSHIFGLRISLGRLAIAGAVLAGAGVGYLAGGGVAFFQSAKQLDHLSRTAIAQTDAAATEARDALKVLAHTSYAPCSDAEIGYLRSIVLSFENLKDAGRIHDGQVECSATGGLTSDVIAALQPHARLDGGILAYSVLDAGIQRTVLRLNDRFVAFATRLPAATGSIPVNLSVTMAGAENLDFPGKQTEGIGYQDRTLYSTRCSALHAGCVTASISADRVLQAQSSLATSSAITGGLMGMLIGFIFTGFCRRQNSMARQLRRAVDRDQLRVVYQPIVNLATQQIVGAEALSRWTDRDGNVIPPLSFIKIAEETGFITSITRQVVKHSFRDLAEVFRNRPFFRLSINVSAADLVDPGFLPMIEESLAEARLRPENLVIEITERAAADNETAMETLRRLRQRGHSIHIDDFGTGYSNLDKLLHLFADTIKIDRAFTSVIGTESVGSALLPQILTMAKTLNLEVVVEGVETTGQADYFAPGEQKIYGQGWLYGRPVSAEAFMALIGTEAMLAPVFTAESPEFTTKPGSLQIVGSMVA